MEEKITQYRKYLEKYLDRQPNEVKILHVLHKLEHLPITLEHLQETGIGKAVNSYRKHESAIGENAKLLVAKWKSLVPVQEKRGAPKVASITVEPATIKTETVSETRYSSADVLSESMRAPYMGERGSSSESNNEYFPAYVPTPIKKEDEMDVRMKVENKSETCVKAEANAYEDNPYIKAMKEEKVMKTENGGYGEYNPSLVKIENSKEYDPSDPPLMAPMHVKSEPKDLPVKKDADRSRSSKDHKSSRHDRESSHKSSHRSRDGKESISDKRDSRSEHQSSSHRDKSNRSKSSHSKEPEKKERHSSKDSSKHKRDHASNDSSTSKSSSSKRDSSKHKEDHRHDESSKRRDHKSNEAASKTKEKEKHKHADQSKHVEKEAKREKTSHHSKSHPNSSSSDHHKSSSNKERISGKSRDKESTPESFIETDACKSESVPFLSFDDLPMNEPKPVDNKSDNIFGGIDDLDLDDAPGMNMSDFELEEDDPDSNKKQVKFKEKDSEDENDNGGLSFEDFLTYDTTQSKPVKKKPAGNSASSKSKSDSRVKGKSSGKSSSTNSSSSKDKHKSSSRDKSSSSHHRSSSSHTKSSNPSSSSKPSSSTASTSVSKSSSSSKNAVKRKPTESLAIPPPPSKQVRLSHDDIMSTLPAISPDYRPLPRVPLHDKPSEELQDMETTLGNLKQNSRTAVYSGRKQVILTEVPSLYNACLRVLMDNLDNLEYVGGVPYDILKPVLDKCTPSQLYTIEDSNPQFIGETDELWAKHSQKDFRKHRPDEFESWRELYLRLHDEREVRLTKLTANISASMKAKAAPVKKTKLAYVDVSAKAPREVRRNQLRYGTAGPSNSDPLSQLTSHGATSKPRPKVPRYRGPGPAPDPCRPERPRKAEPEKRVAPMMAKTLKFMKKLQRR